MRSGTWRHFVGKAKNREDAIAQTFADYDAHRGRRRKPAREAFEVVKTVHIMDSHGKGTWVVYVRNKKRKRQRA